MRFFDRVRDILYERNISIAKFEKDTGIQRQFFYKNRNVKGHRKATIMAIAYYFRIPVEELICGTDAEATWYGDRDI